MEDLSDTTGASDPCYGQCYVHTSCVDEGSASMPTTCATLPNPPYGVVCSAASGYFYRASNNYLDAICIPNLTNMSSVCGVIPEDGCKVWDKYKCWQQFFWAEDPITKQRFLLRTDCVSVAQNDFWVGREITGSHNREEEWAAQCN